MEEIIIRKAKPGDCERLMELMRELAAHENELDSMQINAEDLRRDGFGENPYYGCVVAETIAKVSTCHWTNEKTIIGYALYFYTYSPKVGRCVYMEDLYVQPNHRRKGIGQRLFKEVEKIANDGKCYRLHWGCLEWNKGAMEFYKRQNGVDVTNNEHHIFNIDQPILNKHATS